MTGLASICGLGYMGAGGVANARGGDGGGGAGSKVIHTCIDSINDSHKGSGYMATLKWPWFNSVLAAAYSSRLAS